MKEIGFRAILPEFPLKRNYVMKTADVFVRDVAAVLADLNRKKDVRIFMDALLTPSERARIGLRWRLVCLLAAGVPQRVIAKRLGISLCKITRGSRELKFKPAFRKIVADYKKKRERKIGS